MYARKSVFTWRWILVIGMFLIASGVQCQDSRLRPPRRFAASEMPPPAATATLTEFRIKDMDYVRAYEDVVRILRNSNQCSDFFGGPAAIRIFNELAAQMTKTYSDQNMAIRMYGRAVSWRFGDSPLYYRLFEKAEINARGSFFRASIFDGPPRTPPIGKFPANTREARILMLLHELGHLIPVSPGQWLLPDDGDNEWLSHENTWRVLKHCEQFIRTKRPALEKQSVSR